MAIKVKKETVENNKFKLKGLNKKSKDSKKETKKTVNNNNSYFKGVFSELKEVKWPTTKLMIKYGIATIVFILFMSLFALLVQLIYAMLTRI